MTSENWKDAWTMEEWAEKMLRSGNHDLVLKMMNIFPEGPKKEWYRQLYTRIKKEKEEHDKNTLAGNPDLFGMRDDE